MTDLQRMERLGYADAFFGEPNRTYVWPILRLQVAYSRGYRKGSRDLYSRNYRKHRSAKKGNAERGK